MRSLPTVAAGLGTLLLCWLLVPGLAAGAEGSAAPPLDSLFSGEPAEAERLVLVLHQGRPGQEQASGSRLTMYRARGYERDGTWNRRMARRLAERHGLTYLTDWWMSELDVNCAVLRLQDGVDADQAISRLLADPEVEDAQRLSLYSTLGGPPNDPLFHLQGAASYFDLTTMHEQSTGQGVLVAMVDTGVEMQHQDLNGQVIVSRNFVEQVSPGFSEDLHGTAVAGVIAAHANNGAGIVGMAPGARLVAYKACWPVTEGQLAALCNSFTLALAINQAVAEGVDIINLSLSGPPDRIIEGLIKKALSRGIVVVAATEEQNAEGSVSFPASVAGVIAVADVGHQAWHGSGQPVFAPSNDVLTTLPDDRYNFVSGTSLGAAQVSGYIALLLQINPRLSVADIRVRLLALNDWRSGQLQESPGLSSHQLLPAH